ncbi:hypothetical protein H4582DRAFT_2064324 [Lactarius indigo]|nr:hypothetical protein H4582DRAFT_2064324 [Lactarius indigo]
MPSMHQMQEITPEKKWNAYEARRAARRQLRRRGVTATPSIPESDPAGTTPVPEEPKEGMMPHPEMPYSLSIDLSGVAAVDEEPHQPTYEAYSMAMVDDVPEWVVQRHLERQFGTIEAEAPSRGDAFVPKDAPKAEDAPRFPNSMAIVSDEPEWASRRYLAPTQRPSMIEDEAPIGRDALILEKTLEPERTVREWTMITHVLQTATTEPKNERNSPRSPGWTTVPYKRTTDPRSKSAEPRQEHKMTRSKNEPERSRSGQPRWRGSPDPEISSQAPGMDTGGDQKTGESDENPISRSPLQGDAREFEERSRVLLQWLKSNPEFAALSRSEQRSLLAELMEEEGQKDAEKNNPPAEAMTQPEGDHNETLMLLEEDNNWQGDDNLRKDEAVDNKWESRSPCINHACGDASIEQSRLLLKVLQRNPVFADLPRSEQRLVFAELLENEEECGYLLAQSGEGGGNRTGRTLTGEDNDSLARNDTSILPEKSLHLEETNKQRVPEPEKGDYWADEPEDDMNLETADYWIQFIKDLMREESDELLDNLLEGTTDDLPNNDFNNSTWDEAAVQLPTDSFTKGEAIELVQNNNEDIHPPSDLGSTPPLQEPTLTQNDVSPACLTAPSVALNQEQPIERINMAVPLSEPQLARKSCQYIRMGPLLSLQRPAKHLEWAHDQAGCKLTYYIGETTWAHGSNCRDKWMGQLAQLGRVRAAEHLEWAHDQAGLRGAYVMSGPMDRTAKINGWANWHS